MKNFTLFIATLVLISFSCYADDAVIKEARDAATSHNQSVKSEKEQLEAAIERAKKEYARDTIKIKQDYIRELQKARKSALINDDAEAATIIVQEISRVEKQIEELNAILTGKADKPQEEPKKESEDKTVLKGMPRDLVGHWKFFDRVGERIEAAILADGTYYVISNKWDANENGVKYQLQIVDGVALVEHTKWGNRVDAFRINNGKLNIRSWENMNEYKALNGETTMWNWDMDIKTHRKPISDELMKKIKGEDAPQGPTPVAEEPNQETPKPEEPKNEEPKEVEQKEGDGNTFFGIPVE